MLLVWDIGASVDAAICCSDCFCLIVSGAGIGNKVSTDMANRLAEYNNASPNRVR